MRIFPFVSGVWSAGCVFSCSVGKTAQNANKGRFFTFFLPPFSSHSARHRLPLLGYPLSRKSTRQWSNYKRKNYCLYKLSIYFNDERFHMFFGFPSASGRESVPLVCPHCRLWLPAHSTSIWISAYPECGSSSPVPVRATSRTVKVAVTMGYVFTF